MTTIRKFISVLLTVARCLAFGACSAKSDPAAEAKEAAEQFMAAMKGYDAAALTDLYAGNVESILLTDEDTLAGNHGSTDTEKQYYKVLSEKWVDFDYTVGEATVTENSATVPVSLSTYNFESMLDASMVEFNKYVDEIVAAGSLPSDAELEERVMQIYIAKTQELTAKDRPGTITLKLTKDDKGKWKVGELMTEDLDVFMGGYQAALARVNTAAESTDTAAATEAAPAVTEAAPAATEAAPAAPADTTAVSVAA
ncbi:MAG: hypothetical protein IIZ60_01615 [Clostridia bacterium]|nr:hypothetical protein [Clostridia bacterium]